MLPIQSPTTKDRAPELHWPTVVAIFRAALGFAWDPLGTGKTVFAAVAESTTTAHY